MNDFIGLSKIPELDALEPQHKGRYWQVALKELSAQSPWITRFPLLVGIPVTVLAMFSVTALGSYFGFNDRSQLIDRLVTMYLPFPVGFALGTVSFWLANKLLIRKIRPVLRRIITTEVNRHP